ncbi:hypothetical protein AB1Y20_017700 [Prymnesium parvum]|uniref:Uncharacterized protein n=1 Tax=Prymnesium parvum TaxID=97485 RepID=A0AB34JMI0_PRYPA
MEMEGGREESDEARAPGTAHDPPDDRSSALTRVSASSARPHALQPSAPLRASARASARPSARARSAKSERGGRPAERGLAACVQRCASLDTLPEREIVFRVKALISALRAAEAAAIEELRASDELRAAIRALRKLLAMRFKTVAPTAMRLLRYLVVKSSHARGVAREEFVDLFMIRSLEDRETSSLAERVEALKFFEALMATEPSSISDPQLSSVIAVAECAEDPLREAALERLRRLAVHDVATLSRRDGLKALLQAVVPVTLGEAPVGATLVVPIVHTVCHLLAHPETRAYLKPSDLRMLLAPLTELDVSSDVREQPAVMRGMQVATITVVALCRTWPGLIALSSDRLCLRALLSTLLVPPEERGHLILDSVFELLCMPHLRRDANKSMSERTADARSVSSPSGGFSSFVGTGLVAELHDRPRLVQWYVVVVLQALMHCGLLQVLEEAVRSPHRQLASRAGELLRELLVMAKSDDLMQYAQRLQLHQLASLTTYAMSLRTGLRSDQPPGVPPAAAAGGADCAAARDAHAIAAMLHQVALTPVDAQMSGRTGGANAWRREWSMSGLTAELQATGALDESQLGLCAQRRVDRLAMHEGSQLDEAALGECIRRTQVLSTKVYSDWDWHQIEMLLHGPLVQPARVIKVMTGTKWVKRQLSLLRPEKDCFTRLRLEDPKSLTFARSLYRLIELLLSFEQGAEYFAGRFLVHLSTAFQQYLDAHDPASAPPRETTATRPSVAGEGSEDKGRVAKPSTAGLFAGVGGLFGDGKLRRRTSFDHDFGEAAEDSDDELQHNGAYTRESLSRGGSAPYEPHTFLSEQALAHTMTREYFLIIGMLSASPRGLQLMHKLRLWRLLGRLVQLEGRTDLATLIINSLCYHQRHPSSQACNLLASCVNSFNAEVRLAATSHLGVLATARLPSFADWGVPLLCGLLKDMNRAVRQMALAVLVEATHEHDCLAKLICLKVPPEQLVSDAPLEQAAAPLTSTRTAASTPSSPVTRPPSSSAATVPSSPLAKGARTSSPFLSGSMHEELGGKWRRASTTAAPPAAAEPWRMSVGYVLLLRMLEISEGLHYLKTSGWLRRELAAWQHGRAEGYCVGLEAEMAQALQVSPTASDERGKQLQMELPPHLYGALAKTSEGREILRKARALEGTLMCLADGDATPQQRRAALWAIGHTGSSEGGYMWLVGDVRPSLLEELTGMLSSAYLSVRGTCLFAMGLLSGSCLAAREKLEQLGWTCPRNPGACIALPCNPNRLLSLSADDCLGTAGFSQIAGIPFVDDTLRQVSKNLAGGEELPGLREFLGHLSDLSNPVLERDARMAIEKIRRQQPQLLTSPITFVHSLETLGRCRIKIQARRYVHQLLEDAAEAFSLNALDSFTQLRVR